MKIKITYLAISSIALACTTHAQSLFVEDSTETTSSSIPLTWDLSASVGYDDHFTSRTDSAPEESIYAQVALGVRYKKFGPQTSWRLGARVSANKYLEGGSGDGVYYNTRLNFNINHRLSNRTRYVQRTFFNFGIEPDYSYSFSPTRTPSEHLYYGTDHAIGHRWTPRLATYTGLKFTGVNYLGQLDSDNDRRTYGIYHNFRYSLFQQSILTVGFEYNHTDAKGSTGDSRDIFGYVGLERRLSSHSYFTAQVGASHRDVDGGRGGYFNPYMQLGYNHRVNQQLGLRLYTRYGIENFGTSRGINTYDTSNVLRIGFRADYALSPTLSLYGGVNYIITDFSDGRNSATNAAIADADQTLINPFIGLSWRVAEDTSITASYHYTNTDSDINSFSRNRFQIGVTKSF
eukprot:Seg17011.1 transcript_id=Seg17011.1/GoldUCD/mRNA.D3Y31 product="hypothetical protein" protein_id=Seg17011.1/GoldUCD/D3Y31